jgi:peptidyl-prolyl cis-trans isomerase SurA
MRPLGIAAIAFLAQEPAPSPKGGAPLDRVAAIVNDEVITESELEKRLAPARETFGFDPVRWEEYRLDVLRQLVMDKLHVQEARRRDIPESLIEVQVERAVERDVQMAGSRPELLSRLQQLGKTYDDYLSERRSDAYRETFLRRELGVETGPSGRTAFEIHIPPGALRRYYQAHRDEFVVEEAARARQIWLPFARYGSVENTRRTAEIVLGRLEAGEDFAALAREFSDWRPEQGGDLEWVAKDSPYQRAIVSFALRARAGERSPILETPPGLSIVEVLEKREGEVRPFEDLEVQRQIEATLWRERREESLWRLRRRLLEEAYLWPPDLFPRR